MQCLGVQFQFSVDIYTIIILYIYIHVHCILYIYAYTMSIIIEAPYPNVWRLLPRFVPIKMTPGIHPQVRAKVTPHLNGLATSIAKQA